MERCADTVDSFSLGATMVESDDEGDHEMHSELQDMLLQNMPEDLLLVDEFESQPYTASVPRSNNTAAPVAAGAPTPRNGGLDEYVAARAHPAGDWSPWKTKAGHASSFPPTSLAVTASPTLASNVSQTPYPPQAPFSDTPSTFPLEAPLSSSPAGRPLLTMSTAPIAHTITTPSISNSKAATTVGALVYPVSSSLSTLSSPPATTAMAGLTMPKASPTLPSSAILHTGESGSMQLEIERQTILRNALSRRIADLETTLRQVTADGQRLQQELKDKLEEEQERAETTLRDLEATTAQLQATHAEYEEQRRVISSLQEEVRVLTHDKAIALAEKNAATLAVDSLRDELHQQAKLLGSVGLGGNIFSLGSQGLERSPPPPSNSSRGGDLIGAPATTPTAPGPNSIGSSIVQPLASPSLAPVSGDTALRDLQRQLEEAHARLSSALQEMADKDQMYNATMEAKEKELAELSAHVQETGQHLQYFAKRERALEQQIADLAELLDDERRASMVLKQDLEACVYLSVYIYIYIYLGVHVFIYMYICK